MRVVVATLCALHPPRSGAGWQVIAPQSCHQILRLSSDTDGRPRHLRSFLGKRNRGARMWGHWISRINRQAYKPPSAGRAGRPSVVRFGATALSESIQAAEASQFQTYGRPSDAAGQADVDVQKHDPTWIERGDDLVRDAERAEHALSAGRFFAARHFCGAQATRPVSSERRRYLPHVEFPELTDTVDRAFRRRVPKANFGTRSIALACAFGCAMRQAWLRTSGGTRA
jgi:hypothetical protein